LKGERGGQQFLRSKTPSSSKKGAEDRLGKSRKRKTVSPEGTGQQYLKNKGGNGQNRLFKKFLQTPYGWGEIGLRGEPASK